MDEHTFQVKANHRFITLLMEVVHLELAACRHARASVQVEHQDRTVAHRQEFIPLGMVISCLAAAPARNLKNEESDEIRRLIVFGAADSSTIRFFQA
jgi:hypothetical protein